MPLAIVDLRKIYYEIHGRGTATPLVLALGTGGSHRGWLPLQVPECSMRGPVVICDYRGGGESDDPGTPFTTADLADEVTGLLAELGIEKADILGVFMGGMVAQELALRHPDRLDRLVLAGTYARPDNKRKLLLEQWRDLANSNVSLESNIRERLIWTLQDETLEQADLIEAMVDFYTKESPALSGDVVARQCEACIHHDTADRLRDIQHRTLVICGRRDALTPPKFHRELADEIPNAQLVTMSYGAHLVMAESAERFNDLVMRFLSDRR